MAKIRILLVDITLSNLDPATPIDLPYTVMGLSIVRPPATTVTMLTWDIDEGDAMQVAPSLSVLLPPGKPGDPPIPATSFALSLGAPTVTSGDHVLTIHAFDDAGSLTEKSFLFTAN